MSGRLEGRTHEAGTRHRGGRREETIVEADVLRIYSDPVGAANVMREVVARPKLSARLLEDGNGRWQVVVQGEGAHERLLARVLDLVLRFVEEGRLEFATLEFAGRSITVGRPVSALAAA